MSEGGQKEVFLDALAGLVVLIDVELSLKTQGLKSIGIVFSEVCAGLVEEFSKSCKVLVVGNSNEEFF